MKTLFSLFLMISLTVMLTNSCKKDRDEDPKPTPNPNTVSVPITGAVYDANGNPINGVTVKVGNLSTTTDYSGFFYFPSAAVNIQRFQITFEKSGYFTLYRSGKPQSGKPINLQVGLIEEDNFIYAAQKQINSSVADSIQLPDGSVVSFPANAFVTSNGNQYNGIVKVKACYLDPTWNKYGMFVFGGDLYGVDSANNKVVLNPFIGLNVILEDANGNKLQLDSANNKKATVRMKIPASLAVNAPNQIEMYVYSQGQGSKQGKGSAVKTGDSYQGEVRHFTYWSCEETYTESATIYGYVYKIVNGVQQKISGVPVKVGSQIALTDLDGKYEVTVPAGFAGITIELPSFYNIPTFTLQQALSAGGSYQHDLIIPLQNNFYTISGTVRSASGQALSNASVQLQYYNVTHQQTVYLQTFTNSSGKYSLVAQGGAYNYEITARTSTQTKYVSIYSLTSDTIVNITMPVTPGNNKLVVNNVTIFNITGMPQNGNVFGYFQQELSIYAHVYGSGMFSISGDNDSLQLNTAYFIPSVYSIEYGTQQPQIQDSLVYGTIRFTKFNPQGLVEGNFTGQGSLGDTVTGYFSVPYNTFVRKK